MKDGVESRRVEYADGSGAVNVELGQFVLDALLDAGIDHPFSCRQGICTTCRVRVVSGQIEQDQGENCILSQAQLDEGYRLICVSVAKSDAVIEMPPG